MEMTKNKLIGYWVWVSALTLGIAASGLGMSLHFAHSVQTALFISNILLALSGIVLFYRNMTTPTSWRSRALFLAGAVIVATAVFMLTSLNP
jgi:hypothetical protein